MKPKYVQYLSQLDKLELNIHFEKVVLLFLENFSYCEKRISFENLC